MDILFFEVRYSYQFKRTEINFFHYFNNTLFYPLISILNYYNLDLTYILFIVIIFIDLINKFSDDLHYSNITQKNININFKIKIIIYFSLISWSITGPFLLGQGNTLLGLSSHMIHQLSH